MLLEPLNGLKLFIMPFGGIWGPPQASTRMRNCCQTIEHRDPQGGPLFPTVANIWGPLGESQMLLEPLNGLLFIMPFWGIWGHLGGLHRPPHACVTVPNDRTPRP